MYLESGQQKRGVPQGPAVPQDADRPQPQQLARVRAVVMLAGSVRATSLRKATDRFVMDLPLTRGKTILDTWHDHLDDLAYELGLSHLPARVMVDQSAEVRESAQRQGPAEFIFQRDPLAFRGTGGLLCDIARDYADDDYLIVASANQLLLSPLPRLIEAMAQKHADACLLCDRDYRPRGITLIRCGVLREIARVGFVDLNEQALPEIARKHDVKVCCYPQPAGMAVRKRQDYLDAVRTWHERMNGRCRLTGCEPDEDWSPTFGLVEPDAQVDPTAVIHDSVVLAGARVDADAVLVRSVVGPGGRVGRGDSVVESMVTNHNGRRGKMLLTR